MNLASYRSLFGMEIKKTLSYRVDFWVSLSVSLIAEIVVQWCLWTAIFSSSGATQIGGWSLYGMIFYGILAFFVRRIVVARQFGFLADEIYSGGLNRFLVSPLDLIAAKYCSQVAYGVTMIMQFVIGTGLFVAFFPWPSDIQISLMSSVAALVAVMIGHYLHYTIVATMEMAAFWVDNTWTLGVMWRWVAAILGGALFPLSLFPQTIAEALRWTPFPYFFSWPIEILLGRVSINDWCFGIVVAALWSIFFSWLVRHTYLRGLKVYSGVGI